MLHVRLWHDRAAQLAGTRLGSSTFTIRSRRTIQPIRCPAVVLGQAAAQTEGQRYRILLEVQPCFPCNCTSLAIVDHTHEIDWQFRGLCGNAESKGLYI